MLEPEIACVSTAYGPVDAIALEKLAQSFDTSTLLRAVDLLDILRARLAPTEGLRDDLFRLHGMTHTVLNGTSLTVSAANTKLVDQIEDMLEELEDDIATLRSILEMVRPLAALRGACV